MSAELEIVDRDTGELIAIRQASTRALAATMDELQAQLAAAQEFQRAVEGELLDRLDKDLEWT